MSVVYLLLGGPDADQTCDPFVKGIFTPDRCHVFEIYDFLQIVLIGGKDRKYVELLWQNICRRYPHFKQVQGTLGLFAPSKKMPKTEPTAGTTVGGLQAVLHVLDRNHVTDANRKVLEDIFARYGAGDRSMIVEINLNAKVYAIPRFNYNFQPPSVSHEPVASMIIEDAGAGALEPDASDFSSTENHMVKSNKKRKKNNPSIP